MSSPRLVSPLRPESDETLMSFLRRAQQDADYSETGFNNLLAGSPVVDARRTERRELDWWTLTRFFNATADELHSMSERSLFYEMGDGSSRGHFRQRAPWVQAVGYGAHSPKALRHREHWRKSWLGPAAVICRESRTVLIRHCHGCGNELSAMTWKRPAPVCPACQAHLALGPVIHAGDALVGYVGKLDERFDALLATKPAKRHNYDLAYFAVIWRAARLLQQKWRFAAFRGQFSEEVGVGVYADGLGVAQLALGYAQCVAMAHLICEMEPTLVEHYWLMADSLMELKRADEAVLLKLTETVEAYTGRKLRGAFVRGQTTISLASWSGWNVSPRAA